MPASWAKYAEEKGASYGEEVYSKWFTSLSKDESSMKLIITILGREIAQAANGGTAQRKYQVLVFPDRLRELNTRRHKYLDASFRKEFGIPDPRLQVIMNFRTGKVCRAFLDLSQWSRLLMEDEVLERIDEGKGEPRDIVTLSHRTALIGRQLDERDPELIGKLLREYHPERNFHSSDREYLNRLRGDLLSLAGSITEGQ
jgi:hypothetical protein